MRRWSRTHSRSTPGRIIMAQLRATTTIMLPNTRTRPPSLTRARTCVPDHAAETRHIHAWHKHQLGFGDGSGLRSDYEVQNGRMVRNTTMFKFFIKCYNFYYLKKNYYRTPETISVEFSLYSGLANESVVLTRSAIDGNVSPPTSPREPQREASRVRL